MMRGLERRLKKLESAVPSLPSADFCHMLGLKWFAVAYYLGHPSPNEKPFEAFARALGYTDETELNTALKDRYRFVSKRFSAAEDELEKKFGIHQDVDGLTFEQLLKLEVDELAFEQALKRMEAGL